MDAWTVPTSEMVRDSDGAARVSSMKCVSARTPDPVNPPAMKTTAAFNTMAATPRTDSVRFLWFHTL